MIPGYMTETVNVLRRTSPYSAAASRDSFNNPIYGAPPTWPIVYTNISVRVSLTGKKIRWEGTGETVHPEGVLYYTTDHVLQPDDRIVIQTSLQGIGTGIEYIVASVWPAALLPGGVPDHFQAELQLPQ
ncbi:MAG: hypothetical protein ACRDF4_08080 [Rhabdochlamydiaceae bacterium]